MIKNLNWLYGRNNELQQANHRLSDLFHKEIHTVEIFDNSHIQGAFNVSGLVVYEDGKPDKSQYRHYKLDDISKRCR